MRYASFLLITVLARHAHADAIMSHPACPPGSHLYASHGGIFCMPAPCAAASDCEEREECRAYRVCTRAALVSWGGRRSGPPPPPHEVAFVMGTCEVAALCRGDEEPPPVRGGNFTSEPMRCEDRAYCVPRPWPPLPPPSRPDAVPRAAEPLREPPPAVSPRGCACDVARSARHGFALTALALALALRRRR